MKKLLFVIMAAATLGLVVPAGAQVYFGADPGGVGVQVGPFGAGVGPDYWGYRHRRHWDDAYAYGECRFIRDRIVTPSGRVIIRTHRVCD